MTFEEYVYESLRGTLCNPHPEVTNLFEDGMPCEKWYAEMLSAVACGTNQLSTLTGIQLDIVDHSTHRDVFDGLRKVVFEKEITGNYQRANVMDFAPVLCDQATVTVTQTNGCPDAHIYEVRVY